MVRRDFFFLIPSRDRNGTADGRTHGISKGLADGRTTAENPCFFFLSRADPVGNKQSDDTWTSVDLHSVYENFVGRSG